jgi:hypothetical protein
LHQPIRDDFAVNDDIFKAEIDLEPVALLIRDGLSAFQPLDLQWLQLL